MRYWVVKCALLGARFAQAAPLASGLVIETGSPDALCPDLPTTRQAIYNRLGTLALEGEQRGWVARYTVGHAPTTQGDFIRVLLIDPAGTERLVRDLPSAGAPCGTLSQAIALVVERYFRELAPVEEPPAPTPVPPLEAPKVPPLVQFVPEGLPTPRLALGSGLGWMSADPGAAFGVQVGFWALPAVHVEFGLLVGLSPHPQRLNEAKLELRSYPAEFALGFGERGQIWDLFAGPEVRWTLQKPSATGLAIDSRAGAAFSAGVAGGISYWPGGPLGITLRASADYTLAYTEYFVAVGGAAGSRRVLEEAPFQALTTVGLVWGSRR